MDYTELLPPLSEPEVHDAAGYRRAFTADQVRAAQLAAIAATAPAIRKAEMERCIGYVNTLRRRLSGSTAKALADECVMQISLLADEPAQGEKPCN